MTKDTDNTESLYPIEGDYPDTTNFLEQGKALAFAMIKDPALRKLPKLDTTEIELLSPITAPCRLICQGANYPSSRRELGMDPEDKSFNSLFHKSDASLSGPYDDIIKPDHVQLLDYELELAIVLGQSIESPQIITQQNLHQYVAGIVMVQDVTARDIQIPEGQFFKGKSYRTFCPTGPYLCLLEPHEMHYLSQCQLKLSVNDELRQIDNSQNLIFKPEESLSELSHITNLSPGDMLLTGSPGGCALSVPPAPLVKLMGLLPERLKWQAFIKRQRANPQYLKAGDQIVASIGSADGEVNLGTQINRVCGG
ncbi:fumarylacetoacetate hydrolase family protein [Litoribrevibacter euphylliae]|uniref:Fumarylacetoacetate hydrolase family protein n=1 Tax=Litoribrevibacter euphylliae TaxID=1834034 RepID=A0ABV7H842_9GAMM